MEHTFEKKTTFASLITYTLPTIAMMVFFSLYTIVDGIFISRYVGANALSATNIIYPVVGLLLGVSIMFATGGSAIVAKLMGEKKEIEAREAFSLIISTVACTGILMGVIGIIFINPIIKVLGATPLLEDYCYSYGIIMLSFSPIIMLKMFFDYFLVTAGKPTVGLISAVLGGIINMALDYVFIVPMNMGIQGAALATCIGYTLPCIIGLSVFLNKKNILHFVRFKLKWGTLRESASNGISEMVTQLSGAVTTYLYNIVMLRYLGEDGVAAITIVLYVQFLLVAAHLGFTSGVAPRISYNYGKENKEELKNIMKYSGIFIMGLSVVSLVVSLVLAPVLVGIFSPKGTNVYLVGLNGFKIFSIAFIFCGINIFASGMFTAFSNGKVSAVISLARTLIFFIVGLIILPTLIGLTGVWLVVPFAEVITCIITVLYLRKYRKIYNY